MSWQSLLLPLAPLYAAAVHLRARAYGAGLLRRQRLPRPVVSVGNLSFGGTGKTPTVVSLVRDLVRRGRRPAVLTRGYRRRGREPVVLHGPDCGFSAAEAGDEPLELAERLPGVPIVVDKDRVRGGEEALRLGADLLVLDDGFQHLRLERDLDLVLIDALDPWAGGRLPPRGRLREPLGALLRADAVIVTRVAAAASGVPMEILSAIRALAPEIPVFGAMMRATRVRAGGQWRPVATLAGCDVVACAGIGQPRSFAALLESCGAVVRDRFWFADHHAYVQEDVDRVLARAAELKAVPITTAKDAVKLPEHAGLWVLEAAMEALDGSWDGLWSLMPELER